MNCRDIVLKKIKSISDKWHNIIGKDHIIDIPALGKISETSLTRDSKIFVENNGLPNTFVPGRNLLFFNYASALGWRRNIFDLVGGMLSYEIYLLPNHNLNAIYQLYFYPLKEYEFVLFYLNQGI